MQITSAGLKASALAPVSEAEIVSVPGPDRGLQAHVYVTRLSATATIASRD